MFFGIIGGIEIGISIPLCNLVVGQLLDKLNDGTDNFVEKVNFLCLVMVYIAIANQICGFLQVIELCFDNLYY